LPSSSTNIKVSLGITPEYTEGILNVMVNPTDTTTVFDLLNIDGTSSGITAQLIQATENFEADGVNTGDDSGFLLDAQFHRGFYPTNNIGIIEISGLDSSKTYKLRVSGSCEAGGANRRMICYIDGTNVGDTVEGNSELDTEGNISDGWEISVTGKTSLELECRSLSTSAHPSWGGFDIIEDIPLPVELLDITEETAGSCQYPAGGTCVAQSTHKAVTQNGIGTIVYTWSVTSPATIVSGDGTNTVTVETTGDIDINFDLTCEVSDDSGNF
jgi:hypothetical protein